MSKKVDVEVTDSGSLVGFLPKTDLARQWIDENVDSQSWNWLGGSLYVEHRFASTIFHALKRAGFKLRNS